jgi:hypothetical protein
MACIGRLVWGWFACRPGNWIPAFAGMTANQVLASAAARSDPGMIGVSINHAVSVRLACRVLHLAAAEFSLVTSGPCR